MDIFAPYLLGSTKQIKSSPKMIILGYEKASSYKCGYEYHDLIWTGQQKWTKVLNYGKEKYRFYNPILQNAKHITALKKQLINFSYIPVISVIVFYGDCEIKEIDFVPKDTYVAYDTRVRHVMDKIMSEYPRVYYSNETWVMNILQNAVVNGASTEIQRRHIENIKDMLGEDRVFG